MIGASVALQGSLSLSAAIDFDATLQSSLTLLSRRAIPGAGLTVSLGVISINIGCFVQVDAAVRQRDDAGSGRRGMDRHGRRAHRRRVTHLIACAFVVSLSSICSQCPAPAM